MDLQTEKLLEKYWRGETTVAEERQIKEYFSRHPAQSAEGLYFEKSSSGSLVVPAKPFDHPGRKRRLAWLSVAAALLIGLLTLPFLFNNQPATDQYAVEDPAKALEITRASLRMVSDGLNKGKTYSKELTKFNEAKAMIKN